MVGHQGLPRSDRPAQLLDRARRGVRVAAGGLLAGERTRKKRRRARGDRKRYSGNPAGCRPYPARRIFTAAHHCSGGSGGGSIRRSQQAPLWSGTLAGQNAFRPGRFRPLSLAPSILPTCCSTRCRLTVVMIEGSAWSCRPFPGRRLRITRLELGEPARAG